MTKQVEFQLNILVVQLEKRGNVEYRGEASMV